MDLIKGDSIKILKDIPSESVDLIVTDPPYRVTSHGGNGTMGGIFKTDLGRKGKLFANNNVKISDYAGEFYRILKQGTHCYVMTNHVNLIEMLTEFDKVGFSFIKSLIWDKTNKISGLYYMSQFEYILFFRKGRERRINKPQTADILRVQNKKSKCNGTPVHPTEKPVDLMRILIENSSNIGDTVVDPFMGSGSTGVACIETDRDFIGIEIDDTYYELAKTRIEDAQQGSDMLDFSDCE